MPDQEQSQQWLASPIKTARLVLRSIRSEDLPSISRLWTDPDVRRYVGGPSPAEVVRRRELEYVNAPRKFCTTTRRDGRVVGLVTLTGYKRTNDTEVSYLFLPEHWGHGYAREAVAAVIAWGFEHTSPDAVPRIIAVTQAANDRSRRLLEALGMRHIEDFMDFGAAQTMYAAQRSES